MKHLKQADRKFLKYLVWVTAAVLVIGYVKPLLEILKIIWAVVFPLLIGSMIAYIFNLILKAMEGIWSPSLKEHVSSGVRRGVSLFLSVTLVFAGIFLLLRVILPQLWNAIMTVTGGIPTLIGQAAEWLESHTDTFPQTGGLLEKLKINWSQLMEKASIYLTDSMNQVLNTAFGAVGSVLRFVVNGLVAVIFALYLLGNKDQLRVQIRRLAQACLGPPVLKKMEVIIKVADDSFRSFFIGQFVEAVILGTLCFVGMSILRFPYASMIGALMGATALIPILGAYIGAGLGALLICLVSPLQALEFLVFIVILQQLENNLIYPRVVGTSIGLPGIWVFTSVMIGSGLAGVPGVLLGVPTAATIYKLIGLWVMQREASREERMQRTAEGNRKDGED